VQRGGVKASTDTFQLQAVGKAAADIQSSIAHVLGDFERVYDHAASGKVVPLDMRLEVRRNQARATHRALAAVDDLFLHAGGGSLHMDQPLQRFWRDMHAGMNHIVNVAEPAYGNWALDYFGHELPAGARA
jgi:alkylation response protein AidB-like acyl-CoA dehydrogenase